MSQYKMVVLSNPMPGREQECDHWYQNVHLNEMVTVPGFNSAQRFRVAHPMEQSEPYQYLAVYEIETDSIEASMRELVLATESGQVNVSEDLDTENAYAVIYEACGEAVTAASE